MGFDISHGVFARMLPVSGGMNVLPVNPVLLLGDMTLVQDVGGSASTECQEEARNPWEQ